MEPKTSANEIREAADHLVKSILLKTSDRIPDAQLIREVRVTVERQVNELTIAVQEHLAQVSRHSLPPTFSPSELAKNMGVGVDTVHTWIRNGQLAAIDVSKSQSGRRRYRIDAEAVARFKASRQPSPPPRRRRRRRPMENVTEYF